MESIAIRFAQRRTYSLAQLIDGRILACDRQSGTPVYMMQLRPPQDGKYYPARSGTVDVRGGRVTGVTADAACTGGLVSDLGKSPGRHQQIGKIVDLKNQQLLLIRDQQAFILDVVPALDGTYAATGVGAIQVRNGTAAAAANGDPIFNWPDDFAP